MKWPVTKALGPLPLRVLSQTGNHVSTLLNIFNHKNIPYRYYFLKSIHYITTKSDVTIFVYFLPAFPYYVCPYLWVYILYKMYACIIHHFLKILFKKSNSLHFFRVLGLWENEWNVQNFHAPPRLLPHLLPSPATRFSYFYHLALVWPLSQYRYIIRSSPCLSPEFTLAVVQLRVWINPW